MKKNQRKYPPAEIVGFLRQNLLEKVPVSEMPNKFDFYPTGVLFGKTLFTN